MIAWCTSKYYKTSTRAFKTKKVYLDTSLDEFAIASASKYWSVDIENKLISIIIYVSDAKVILKPPCVSPSVSQTPQIAKNQHPFIHLSFSASLKSKYTHKVCVKYCLSFSNLYGDLFMTIVFCLVPNCVCWPQWWQWSMMWDVSHMWPLVPSNQH